MWESSPISKPESDKTGAKRGKGRNMNNKMPDEF